VTFDGVGVSGHPNHIAIYTAVRALVHTWSQRSVPLPLASNCFALHSELNPLRKYCGPFDAALTLLSLRSRRATAAASAPTPYVFADGSLSLSQRVMIAHWSQYVWYRFLFVCFSRYTYLNTLRRIQ
jgi:N-acetylglucosaminylphosphatidylinositol deacetylase